MKDDIITPDFFGQEFDEKYQNLIHGKKRFHPRPIKFLENHDLKQLENDSKAALLQGRCVIRIDKYCVVIADSLPDWKRYKSDEKLSIETLKKNETLKDDPLLCAMDELCDYDSVTMPLIREVLGKYLCFSPENLSFAKEYVSDEGVKIDPQ